MNNTYSSEDMVQDQNHTHTNGINRRESETPGLDFLTLFTGVSAKDFPNEVFLYAILSKESLTKNDLLDATGLSKKDYPLVFDEESCKDGRDLRFDLRAIETLSKHLEREDLKPHQYAISELIWRRMQFISIMNLEEQFESLTGRRLEEDYPDDAAFQEEAYTISPEDLDEAMVELLIHIEEISDRIENMFNQNQ